MPRAQRNMTLILKTEQLLPDEGIRDCFQQIAQSLKFVHDKGFIHANLKPHNCGTCRDCLRALRINRPCTLTFRLRPMVQFECQLDP